MGAITSLFGGVWGYVIAGLVIAAMAGFATHEIDADHYTAIIETNTAQYTLNMKAVSDTAEKAAADNLKTLQDQLAQTSADAAAAHKELSDAHEANAALSSSIGAGTRRLSVAGVCPAGGSGVSGSAATGPGVHAATRVQLDPAAAQRIVTIANDADDTAIMLKQCQAYVTAVQRK